MPAPDYGTLHPKAGKPRGLPAVPQAGPDTIIDGADFDGLTVRAVSSRGDDHRYNGEHRQDSMGLWTLRRLTGSDVLLMCVADGVGSEPRSHEGSLFACQLLRKEVAFKLESLVDPRREPDLPQLATEVVQRVARRMAEHAEHVGLDPKALSTTLMAALVELTPATRPRRTVAFGVGDSGAYILRDGVFQGLLADERGSGPIADFRTDALPSHMPRVETAVEHIGNDDVLLICTDGLVNPMTNEQLSRQLITWWTAGPVPGFTEFAWQLSFRVRSYGDDRTAICAWGR